MFYLLFILTTILFCSHVNALVTVLCNHDNVCSGTPPICTYLIAGCVLYDNGHPKLSKSNSYPISYNSGGFDQNGYHIEFYFNQGGTVSIETPNGGDVTRMEPASRNYGFLYFAFNDQPLQQGADDARNACYHINVWIPLALSCDDVYEEALKVYKPN